MTPEKKIEGLIEQNKKWAIWVKELQAKIAELEEAIEYWKSEATHGPY